MTSPRSWIRRQLPLAGDPVQERVAPGAAPAATPGPNGATRAVPAPAGAPPAVGPDEDTTVDAPPAVGPDEDGPDEDLPTGDAPDEDVPAQDVHAHDLPAHDLPDGEGPARRSHLQRRREWRQEERARRYAARRSVRFPIFTRSVLLWMVIFALFGLAFGGSGAFWWAHFNTQVAEIREDTADIEARSSEALAEIEAERNASLTQIAEASAPLEDFLAEARTVQLAEVFADTVWFVATLDGDGRPSVGSAFAVASDPGGTLLVTSHATVEAATVQPAPEITLRNGTEELPAELVSTDPERDLALVRIARGDLPVLEWATDEQQARALGSRVFAVSGFGGLDAFLTPGLVVDQSSVGFLHTAPVGSFLQGGPLVLADGRVIGVTSTDYRPLDFDPGDVHFSVQINAVCERLLDCGGGRQEREGPDAPPPEEDLGTVEPD